MWQGSPLQSVCPFTRDAILAGLGDVLSTLNTKITFTLLPYVELLQIPVVAMNNFSVKPVKRKAVCFGCYVEDILELPGPQSYSKLRMLRSRRQMKLWMLQTISSSSIFREKVTLKIHKYRRKKTDVCLPTTATLITKCISASLPNIFPKPNDEKAHYRYINTKNWYNH